MASIGDTITAALQDLNVIEAGATPSDEDSQLALSRVNEWIDGLANKPLAIFARVRTTWTITTASSYSIGSGSTINVRRPAGPSEILDIGFQDTSFTPDEETLVDLLTDHQYAAIPNKALTSVYPQAFYYNPSTSSAGTITPWPVPSGTTLEGVIYTRVPVAEFATLATTFTAAPGYRRFFRTNLVIELAAAFQATPSPAIVRAADESRAAVMLANYRPLMMRPDGALVPSGGAWNVNTDSYNRGGV